MFNLLKINFPFVYQYLTVFLTFHVDFNIMKKKILPIRISMGTIQNILRAKKELKCKVNSLLDFLVIKMANYRIDLICIPWYK